MITKKIYGMFYVLLLSSLSAFAEKPFVTVEKVEELGVVKQHPVSSCSKCELSDDTKNADLAQQKDCVPNPFEMTAISPTKPDQSPVTRSNVPKQEKQIARCVFFDSSIFPNTNFEIIELQGKLRDMNVAFSMIARNEGMWFILLGNEDIVKELYAVFAKIANNEREDKPPIVNSTK
jgi:hypothetical protein